VATDLNDYWYLKSYFVSSILFFDPVSALLKKSFFIFSIFSSFFRYCWKADLKAFSSNLCASLEPSLASSAMVYPNEVLEGDPSRTSLRFPIPENPTCFFTGGEIIDFGDLGVSYSSSKATRSFAETSIITEASSTFV
jgi:hypothetical protein